MCGETRCSIVDVDGVVVRSSLHIWGVMRMGSVSYPLVRVGNGETKCSKTSCYYEAT